MSDKKPAIFEKSRITGFCFFMAGNCQSLSEIPKKCPYYVSGQEKVPLTSCATPLKYKRALKELEIKNK